MTIVETPEMWVVGIRRRLTIPQIKNAAADCAPVIEQEIARHGLVPAGPWIFISHHLAKDGKTLFDWQICRPVEKPQDDGACVDLYHLEPTMVASAVHRGSIRTLFTQGYRPLVQEIEMSRHEFSGESREIYHHWSGPGSPYHQIEIQFGLSR